MAQQFNLTAQINLQSPKNVGKVVSDIQRQLKGSGLNTVNIKVKADARSIAQTNKQLQNVGKNSRAAAKDIGTLNRSLQEATRRFSVITLATGSLLSFVSGIKNSTKAAIEFERELVKISQVTGKSVQQLQGLTKEVTRLSTAFGVSSADLLNVSRTLAQAGFSAEKTRKALDILAKTTLAATFDNIQDTTEGAIALLRQFGDEAKRTGGDVAFLEKSLSAINSVSKKFAVESGDLITVVRRVGGVFSSAGGSINELIALFTSVRATTRESAETIATGLRTIFTRIQRTETIDQLKSLNIHLQDSQGKFVGAFEAVKRLSQGLASIDPREARFSKIVEQLGGFRQIGKVIPLIQQFSVAQDALSVAQGASGSVAKDATKAQQGLGVQITKVKEEFTALIRKFTDSGPFNTIATGALKIASAMIKVMEAVEPLIPLLTTMFMMKIGRSLAPGIAGMAGMARRGGGGPIGVSKFAKGGVVPGKGNRDTVPAMLTPGEFVIRKSSVKKLGAGRLAQMNNNRYSNGGYVSTRRLMSKSVQGSTTIANTLNANRGKGWSVIDEFKAPYKIESIDPFGKGVSKKLKKEYQSQPTASKRGFAFENIVAAKTGTKLKKGNAFLDVKGGEIKSDKGFAEKKSGGLGSKAYKTVVAKALNTLLMTKKVEDLGFTSKKDKRDLSKVTVYTDPSISQWENNRKLISKGKEPEGLNKGGLIQKFALGGLATKNKVGFAILDPDQGGPDLDAKVTRAQVRGAVSGTDAQRKALDKEISWPNKNYKVARQGLPAKTSQKFYGTIAQEAANGVGVAANSLSNSLGLGSVSMPEDAKQTMAGVIKKSGSQMGVLFEDVLRVMDSKGPFKPAPKGAPIDFRGGLQGGLKSTYNRMPSSFVDARTSYDRSKAPDAQGKIVREIAQEYMNSSSYKTATTKKKGLSPTDQAAADKRRAKQQAKMAKMEERAGFAKGGAATDTIPALLTPGEFVFNAKAAKSIGHANLNRMNKKGVQGFARGGSVGERLGNARAGAASSLAAIDPIAQSAQNFVFLGASVAAVTTQLSGMEDATKRAINETVGFASGVIGIGATLISSFSAMAASKTVEKVATDQNTKATAENTIAKKADTASENAEVGIGKAGKAIGALTIGITAAATVFTFFSAKARANADNIAKSTNESLQKLKSGTAQNLNDIKAGYRKEAAARAEAAKFTLNPLTGNNKARGGINLAGAGAGALAGGKAGAFAGSFFGPGIGTAIGGAIGAAIGGIGGAFGANYFQDSEKAIKAETEARNKELQAINQTVDSLALLYASSNKLATVEKQIAAAPGLSKQEVASRRLRALDEAGGVRSGARLKKASSDSQFLRSQVGESLGISAQQVTEEQIKAYDESGIALSKYKLLQETAAAAQQEINDRLKISATALDALTSSLDGKKTFDELIAEGGQFAQSLKARQDAVRDAGLAERDAAARAVQAAEDRAKTEKKGSEAQAKAQKDLEAAKENEKRVINQTQQAYEDVGTSAENGANAIYENAESLRRARKAQVAVEIEMRKLAKTSEILDAALLGIADQAKAVDRFVAVLENRTSKIEASRVDEIDDVTAIGDINKFAKQVREVSVKGGAATAEIGESLIQNAATIKKAGSALLGFDANELGDTADFAEQIKKATGLDELTTPGGKKVFTQMVENLSKIDGAVGEEDIKNILAPLARVSQVQADQIVKLINLEQSSINLYEQKLNALDAIRAKELEIRKTQIDALEKSADLNVRAANLLAKSIDPNALGIDPGIIQQKLADQAAQMSLDDLDLGLEAGNVRQIARFRKQAQNNRLKLLKDETVSAKDRMAMERRFIKIIDVTGKELERLGDQSGKAGILMGEMEKNISAIEKERAAREQMTGVIEDFVIGGPEERGNLVSAANGIRQAFASGTLQMQTPDQRKATVGLLDRLGDVKLFGNITGKEIKKQLIFKDAIRLGLPPKLAGAIANGTSTEEKLIQANKDLANQIQLLTMQMFMATMSMQANAGAGDAGAAMAAAKGGPVYKNNGGTIFKPRGTDTVPAMLTPGEFVIRKSSVDQIGAGNLAALNSGDAAVVRSKGGPIYRAGGGLVNYLNDGGQGQTLEERLMGQYGIKTQSKGDFNKYFKNLDIKVDRANKEFGLANITQNSVRAASVIDPTGILDVANIVGSAARIGIEGDASGDLRRSMGMDAAFAATSVVGGRLIGAGVGAARSAKAAKAAKTQKVSTATARTSPSSAQLPMAQQKVLLQEGQKFTYSYNQKAGRFMKVDLATNRSSFASANEAIKANPALADSFAGNMKFTSTPLKTARDAGGGSALRAGSETPSNIGDAKKMRAIIEGTDVARTGAANVGRFMKTNKGFQQALVAGARNRAITGAVSSAARSVGAGAGAVSSSVKNKLGGKAGAFFENLISKPTTPANLKKQFIDFLAGGGGGTLLKPALIAAAMQQYQAAGGIVDSKVTDAAESAVAESKMKDQEAAEKKYLDSVDKTLKREVEAEIAERPWLLEDQPQQAGLGGDGRYKSQLRAFSSTDEAGIQKQTERMMARARAGQRDEGQSTTLFNPGAGGPNAGAKRAVELEDKRQNIMSSVGPQADAQARQKELVKQILIKQQKEKKAADEKRATLASQQVSKDELARERFAAKSAFTEDKYSAGGMEYMARFETDEQRADRRAIEYVEKAAFNAGIGEKLNKTKASQAKIDNIRGAPSKKFYNNETAQKELGDILTPGNFRKKYEEKINADSNLNFETAYSQYRNAWRMGRGREYTVGSGEFTDEKFNESLGFARGGPVYRAFGGGIGYGRGGYGAGNTGQMQAARGNQFMMQQHQRGMNFMNQTRNRAITPNISRMGRGNFAGGNSLRARKAQELFPYDPNGVMLSKPFGPNLEGTYEKFNSILRRNGPQFALKYAFGGKTPPGAYVGPKGAGKKKAEELNPEQMQTRMIQMMYNQMRRQEAQRRQQQQQQRGGGVRPLGRAAGGGVPGGDTVPAMLTPGEFVMSAGAVRQHGVGAMKSLNRGQVPGFNRGGVVGGVQYRQDGGGILGNMASGAAKMMGLDTSEMGSLFDNFVGSFSKTLDNLTNPLTLLAASMNNLADKFGNFTMTHKIEVSGLPDIDANLLGNQLGQSIAKNTVEKVQSALDENNNNFNVA